MHYGSADAHNPNDVTQVQTAPADRTDGNTPLVSLNRICPPGGPMIHAKCEHLNPTGSHKDRVFRQLIDRHEAAGDIRPGMTLVEVSNGNGGAALCRQAQLRGYKALIVIPAGMTVERKRQIADYGGEYIETPAEGFLAAAEELAETIAAADRNSFYFAQSVNPGNAEAWREAGLEIIEQLRARDVSPECFVCSVGTGGTFSGIARELRARFPLMKTVAVEVDKSAAVFARRRGIKFEHRPHNLIGLGPGRIPGCLDDGLVDDVEIISGDESWMTMERLAREEGLKVGPTSGANVAVALRRAQSASPGHHIVTVLFDSAWKYESIPGGTYELYGGGEPFDPMNPRSAPTLPLGAGAGKTV